VLIARFFVLVIFLCRDVFKQIFFLLFLAIFFFLFFCCLTNLFCTVVFIKLKLFVRKFFCCDLLLFKQVYFVLVVNHVLGNFFADLVKKHVVSQDQTPATAEDQEFEAPQKKKANGKY
jgi:hypothetical protein